MTFFGRNKGDNYLRSSYDMVALDGDPDTPSAQGQSIPLRERWCS